MYSQRYIPTNQQPIYRSSSPSQTVYQQNGDDRFFLAPFLVGGLAGTALGYGIANNNQINNGPRPCCGYPYPVYPVPYQQPMPYQQGSFPNNFSSYNSNNFYY